MRDVRGGAAVAVAAAVLILAAGCGGGDGAVPSGFGNQPLTGRTFLSETVTRDGVRTDLVAGTQIWLEFPEAGQLRATAGCNILFAEVVIGSDRLQVSGVGGTEMGCDQPLHDQDQWLADVLESSPSWRLDGDRLTLTSGATTLVLLDRRVADPDRDLAGTRWVVDTIITGDAASSMVADTEGLAWLVIEGDTVRASSGCREFEGQVTHGQGRLTFHDVSQTDPACPPELEQVDEVMRSLLAAEVAYSIEADRLRLDHPEGFGLSLHADE